MITELKHKRFALKVTDHAKQRLKQRYGLVLSNEQYGRLAQQITEGKKSVKLRPLGKGRELWMTDHKGDVLLLICTAAKFIVTFLPPRAVTVDNRSVNRFF